MRLPLALLAITVPVLLQPALAAPRSQGADGIPNLDYRGTCRDAPPVATDQQSTLRACMETERRAKEDLPVQWARSKPEWKQSCVKQTTLGGLPSYVELLTCLEMHDPKPPSTNRPLPVSGAANGGGAPTVGAGSATPGGVGGTTGGPAAGSAGAGGGAR